MATLHRCLNPVIFSISSIKNLGLSGLRRSLTASPTGDVHVIAFQRRSDNFCLFSHMSAQEPPFRQGRRFSRRNDNFQKYARVSLKPTLRITPDGSLLLVLAHKLAQAPKKYPDTRHPNSYAHGRSPRKYWWYIHLLRWSFFYLIDFEDKKNN